MLFRSQYEDIAAHSREEAESWYKNKVREKMTNGEYVQGVARMPKTNVHFMYILHVHSYLIFQCKKDISPINLFICLFIQLFVSVFLQFDQMAMQASQYGDELKNIKGEIADLNRMISRLQSEIEAVKAQVGDRG